MSLHFPPWARPLPRYPSLEAIGLPLWAAAVPAIVGIGNYLGPPLNRYLKRNHSTGALRALRTSKKKTTV